MLASSESEVKHERHGKRHSKKPRPALHRVCRDRFTGTVQRGASFCCISAHARKQVLSTWIICTTLSELTALSIRNSVQVFGVQLWAIAICEHLQRQTDSSTQAVRVSTVGCVPLSTAPTSTKTCCLQSGGGVLRFVPNTLASGGTIVR